MHVNQISVGNTLHLEKHARPAQLSCPSLVLLVTSQIQRWGVADDWVGGFEVGLYSECHHEYLPVRGCTPFPIRDWKLEHSWEYLTELRMEKWKAGKSVGFDIEHSWEYLKAENGEVEYLTDLRMEKWKADQSAGFDIEHSWEYLKAENGEVEGWQVSRIQL